MSVAILKYRRYYIDRIISQTLAHDERCLGPRSEREAPTASLQAILVPAAHRLMRYHTMHYELVPQ